MNPRRKVAVAVAVVVLAATFLVPFIPATIAVSPDPSLTSLHYSTANQTGWAVGGVEGDPVGTIFIFTLSQMPCAGTTCWTTDAMNLTTYHQLEHDSYMGGVWDNPTCESFVQGAVVLFTCPQPRCGPGQGSSQSLNASGLVCEAITRSTPTVGNGTESVAYLLLHQGAVYYYGKYLWV